MDRHRSQRQDRVSREDTGLDLATADQARTNRGLAVMVVRAHRWLALLESGRYASIRGLALDAGVDNSYLARMLRLTLLAPDLTEAILSGTEPDGLSLEKLYRLPMEWEEQRRALGRDPVGTEVSPG